MKRILPFSRFFLPALVLSSLLVVAGIAGYFLNGGFNLGVDFQAGLVQEVQFAPTALNLSYSGRANASVSFGRAGMDIVVSGAGIEGVTHEFPYTSYPTLNDLRAGLLGVEGVGVSLNAPGATASTLLIQSTQGNPLLGAEPYVVHYLPPDSPVVPIEEVRSSLESLGTVSVQILGDPADRHFMIRMQEDASEDGVSAEQIIAALETAFGADGVAITRSDYVSSRFSEALTAQAGLLILATLALILIYASIRFKPQYAVGAVLAIAHDALIMVAFFVWSRMEFNTTSIAAILTILGYSINDTIVIFDRIRETRRIYPDDPFMEVLNRAISETLGRTVITTVTTMLAVVMLFIFTTGSMKDFALALLVGMTSGVYSTIFIASGFVNLWESVKAKRVKKERQVK
ncbi:MAG: protein translocase subunit SecF [Treponema sp.]|jgi:preprotein translocase subunit SecF|nr:protein translocase subunit SecF [Treponema sp.]